MLHVCHWGALVYREEGLKEVQDKVKPYDWTFTTSYKGSVRNSNTAHLRVSGVMSHGAGDVCNGCCYFDFRSGVHGPQCCQTLL